MNIAALGESWLGLPPGDRPGGKPEDPDCTVFIALGTGIGMGTVIGGRLLRGATGAAGEIASLPIGADPLIRRCSGRARWKASSPAVR